MQLYNKFMLYFWLFAAVFTFIVITYMGIIEGFETWVYYYVISLVCAGMYFFRKWMIRRMERHMEYLENQKKNEGK